MPDAAIFVSVTMEHPPFNASMPSVVACSENTSVSAYSKSADVWMTRFTTSSFSGSSTLPASASSAEMISKLRASMSAGFTCASLSNPLIAIPSTIQHQSWTLCFELDVQLEAERPTATFYTPCSMMR